MKTISLILWVILLFSGACADDGNGDTTCSFSDRVKLYADYPTDSCREVALNNETIELPYARLIFNTGKLYLTGYISGRPTVAYFQGDGEFEYYPLANVEAQQVRRFYFSDSVSFEFDEAYISFPEQSSALEKYYTAGVVKKMPSRVRGMSKALKKIPGSKFKYNLPLDIYRATVENRPEFLWINVRQDRHSSTIYLYNPYDEEQVSLYKYAGNFRQAQLVSSVTDMSIENAYVSGETFNAYAYNINLDINTTGKSEIACTINMTVISDSMKLASFGFPDEFKIDSIGGDVADSLSFIHEKKYSGLTVDLSRFFHKGDTLSITVWYRGNLFRQYIGYGVIQEFLTRWYPYNGFRQLSEYGIHYRIDEGLTFLAVGTPVSDSTAGSYRYLEYQSPGPVAYVTFNYGKFDTTIVTGNPVPITIYSLPIDKSAVFGHGALNDVAIDIEGSLRFFSDYIAPYPFDDLIVDAMATEHGQGSPGMVHLSEITFRRDTEGLDDKFRAHEVAHQWWGHLVGPKNYHDLWLSEGLAEYFAAMYIEQYKKDTDTFRDILKDWRKYILQRGRLHGKKSDGYRAGSIYLGSRLLGEMSPGDYEALVYYKAAYMLHMLRMELNLDNEDNDIFMKFISRFARRYSGTLVTTGNFIEAAREYMGDRTDTFFRQWLFDWRIPRIKKDWKLVDNGAIELEFKITDIAPDFESPYPIQFVYSDGTSEWRFYTLKTGDNRFEYKPAGDLEIEAVRFNPNMDILER